MPELPDDEPPRESFATWWRSVGRAAFAPTSPRLPSPAPASRTSRPAPALPAPAPAAVRLDPGSLSQSEETRRSLACQIFGSIPGASVRVWYDQPSGACEALDLSQPQDRRRCPGTPAFAVEFHQGYSVTHVYACHLHARPLASVADLTSIVTATVHRVK
ncbi:hypothetical protein [Streptomyces sp. NBC_01506]|uniref:hypothetical protein n=1 Tax=Streptomyces sp. NBC_01506 TaxID=2903887 RepID=UPI003863ADD9